MGRGARAQAVPPLGFLPLERMRVRDIYAHDPGLPHPVTIRLQGFSPSWRLVPPRAFRACFIPVALVGFHPSELFPLEEPLHLSVPAAFLTSPRPECPATPNPASSHAEPWPKRTVHRDASRKPDAVAFKALLPSRVRCRRAAVWAARGSMLSWASSSPGASSPAPRPPVLGVQLPWASSARPSGDRGRRIVARAALRSISARRFAALSQERSPLVRFPTLSRRSAVRKPARSGLMISPRIPGLVAAPRRILYGPSHRLGRGRDDGM